MGGVSSNAGDDGRIKVAPKSSKCESSTLIGAEGFVEGRGFGCLGRCVFLGGGGGLGRCVSGGGGGGVGSLLVVGSGGEGLEGGEGRMVASGLATPFNLDGFPFFCGCGFGGGMG